MLNDLHLAHSDVLDKILSQCKQKFAFWLNLQNRLTTDVIVHPFTVHERRPAARRKRAGIGRQWYERQQSRARGSGRF